MRLKLFLRLLLAVAFALPAFIFSEVVPDIPPFNRSILRLFITLWFGLLGYGVFPDMATRITTAIANITNTFTSRVSTEVMSQMLRLQKQATSSTSPTPAAINNVSLPLVLDTSVIIDGRILDIAKTGFIFGTLLLPEFVLTELQQVADSNDFLKRSRGRRGFETIEELKKIKGIRLEIWEKEVGGKQVDDKVIKLAKSLHGRILTTDYNLNRVASLSGGQVLNINDLANALKTLAVPGEMIDIKVVHLGKDPKQGVGYFNDGTMIVVEDGGDLVGKEVKAEVTRMLQSSAGRMVFAKLHYSQNHKPKPTNLMQ